VAGVSTTHSLLLAPIISQPGGKVTVDNHPTHSGKPIDHQSPKEYEKQKRKIYKKCNHSETITKDTEFYPDGDPNSVQYHQVTICLKCGEEIG
jgi:hypothetical protein